MTQLETIEVCDSQKTPAPSASAMDPLVKVKPERVAPLIKYTHRLDWPPSMIVNFGPLTLSRVRHLTAAPTWTGLYVPFVTSTNAPGPDAASNTSTASWIL